MKKLKKLFSGNSLLLTSIVLLLILIVFFGVSYVTETPPTIKDLRITNISDTSVTVTYFTEVPTFGSVIVSDKNDFDFLNQLSRTRYYDDRKDGELRYSHHITVSGLKPSSAYFFEVMGNLKNVKYTYPVLQTGKTLDTLVTPDPTYGSFSDNTSMDSIVYLSIDGSTLQSTYLGTGNTFSMDKANIRTPDLEDQATYKYHDPILIEILNKDTQLGYQTNVGSDQPTAKFETTANKETSKIKLNTSVLGSVYAAECNDKTEKGATCTGPNGYQYTLGNDGVWKDDVAQMQDYFVQTGITGSKDFTDQVKKDAAKGNDQGPFSPTNPAPIPVNAKLPLCNDKEIKVDDQCRGVENGFTYTKTKTGWDDTIAKEQNADKNLLFADPTLTKEQEAQANAEKAKLEAEHKALCDALTDKNITTKKDENTIFNCNEDGKYYEKKCGVGEKVLERTQGHYDRCGVTKNDLVACPDGSKIGEVISYLVGPGKAIVRGCNQDGTGEEVLLATAEETKPLLKYGVCEENVKLTDVGNNDICKIKKYFNSKGECAVEVAFDCDKKTKDGAVAPVIAPVAKGPAKEVLAPVNPNGNYYNLTPEKINDINAKTFDTSKITKTCGGGKIPDTEQSGQFTLNTEKGTVFRCVGDLGGGGQLIEINQTTNKGVIEIGVVGSRKIEKDDTIPGTARCNKWNDEKHTCCLEILEDNLQISTKLDGTDRKTITYTKPPVTNNCDLRVTNPDAGNCDSKKYNIPWCSLVNGNPWTLTKCENNKIRYYNGQCDPTIKNPGTLLPRNLISPVNAQVVLGVSDSSGVELSSTGKYNITSGNTSVKEFKVMDLVNGKARIVFFEDKNANGIRDTGEEDITTPVEVKIEKTSDISRFELNEGWNLVAYEYTEARTAKDLLANISSNGGYATHVATYRQGGWVMYSERGEKSFGTNFNLIPGEGYFVKVIKSGKLSFEGKKIASNQPYRLSNGWNLLSFRLDPALKASKLIDAINLNTPVSSDVVTRYVSGKYENVVKDKDTVYGSDFDIEENKGYFVRVTKGGVVIMK